MSRPLRDTPAPPIEPRVTPIGDLEPPRRIVKTPRHPKADIGPPRDSMPSRASNVSKKRSKRTIRGPSPDRLHGLINRLGTKTTFTDEPGYLNQGVANVKNFGNYWNGFITDLLQQLETADGELKAQRQELAQFAGQIQKLQTDNDDLCHRLETREAEKRQILDENGKLREEAQQQECRIHELQTEHEEKTEKLHTLAKKLRDRLNAMIKDGQASYAAGKERWMGAIAEAKATSDALSSLKASLSEESAKVQSLNLRLEDLNKDIDARVSQRR